MILLNNDFPLPRYDPYWVGFQAGYNDLDSYCPYPYYSYDAAEWWDGYEDGLIDYPRPYH